MFEKLEELAKNNKKISDFHIRSGWPLAYRQTGEITYGKVPAYSVVVPGTMPNKKNPDGPSLYCAVIVKKVDEKTRSKTSINDLLRD